jgi:hypothetical protein
MDNVVSKFAIISTNEGYMVTRDDGNSNLFDYIEDDYANNLFNTYKEACDILIEHLSTTKGSK